MGISDHLTCLLRNLYAGQEATVRTGHGTIDAEYIMRNAGLDEAQAGIKTAGRNNNNLRYADDTTLMAEKLTPNNCLLKLCLFLVTVFVWFCFAMHVL